MPRPIQQSTVAFRPQRTASLLIAAIVLTLSTTAPATEHRRTAVVKAYQDAKDSIVNIHGRKTVRAEQPTPSGDHFKQVNGMGTGVIIDPRGYILTNYHVVEGVANIQISYADKRPTTARLVVHDPKTDLAVIKVESPNSLPVIKLGTSSDLMTGESVIAVGNAYGYEHSLTRGVISALHRPVQVGDDQQYNDLIQTDAPINPGNSGGPLMNIDGEVIGINVAVRVGAQCIGFAIPIDEALDVAARLLSSERMGQIAHGINGKTEFSPKEKAFIVTSVRKDTAAEKAGVQAGDRIVKIGDRTVERALDIELAMLGKRNGEELSLEVVRGGEKAPCTHLACVSSPKSGATAAKGNLADRVWAGFGMKLEPIDKSEFAELNSHYRGGLRVLAVRPDGPAADQGIRKGDVLVGMHVWQTISLENVAYVLDRDDLDTLNPLIFYILREGDTLFGHIRLAKRP